MTTATDFVAERDHLSDEALTKIEELVPHVLQDFEIRSLNYTRDKVTVIFGVPNLFAQYNPLADGNARDPIDALCHAAMCTDALCKNLREARRERDEAIKRIEELERNNFDDRSERDERD